MTMKKILILLGAMLVLAAILAACGGKPEPTQAPAPTGPTATEVSATPTEAPLVVPNLETFQASGHADNKSEAFHHWDSATPAEVPTDCAKCHTSAGFQDFAADGKVDKAVAAPAGTLACETCHNDAAEALTSVTFPSGKVVETSEEGEAICMQCHQGRESKVSVDKQIADFNATDLDKVPAPIKGADGKDKPFGFLNVHYFAAGGTLYGSQAQMGYEYDGKIYDPKFRHVEGFDTCVACHDQHATQVRVEKCALCHEGVKTVDDLKNNREPSSLVDYNGNGDVKEGIYYELKGLQDALLAQIQTYAKDTAGQAIVYSPDVYPYFFVDTNGNGQADTDEAAFANAYKNWTPRLLKAAYNYQASVKDPGAFAHNAKYMIELTYDSIQDLGGDVSKYTRDDAGHFAGNTMPFRDWDETGEVPYTCAKCHTATGLPEFLHNGGSLVLTPSGSLTVAGIGNQPTSNGFMCSTCHDEANWPNRYAVTTVPFPSGAKLTFSTEKDDKGNLKPVDANLCLECHQGRESTNSINAALKAFAKEPDKVAVKDDGSPALSFKNIHYLAAGATLFGDAAKGAYQYDGQQYVGQNVDHPLNKCTDCHDVHQLGVKVEACQACHTNVKSEEDLQNIRMDKTDYNGNGDTSEGIYKEVDSFRVALYAAIQSYAETKAGTPIVYDPATYPYFFVDADKDGKADTNDKGPIAYNAWTPRLLQAAYNYQYSVKDPGAFAHNPKYVLQTLYDSTKDLGGDVTKFTRPTVQAPAQ